MHTEHDFKPIIRVLCDNCNHEDKEHARYSLDKIEECKHYHSIWKGSTPSERKLKEGLCECKKFI